MTVFVFKDRGGGSRAVHRAICDYLPDVQEDSVWRSSTYYGTKSPDRKLTAKELLSIICPHIFLVDACVIANLKREVQTSLELIKIEGFVGTLCGKLERAHLSKLVEIIRLKKQKRGSADRILNLSIYDCIADPQKAIEQGQSEIVFCDNFFKQYVAFPTDRRLRLPIHVHDDVNDTDDRVPSLAD